MRIIDALRMRRGSQCPLHTQPRGQPEPSVLEHALQGKTRPGTAGLSFNCPRGDQPARTTRLCFCLGPLFLQVMELSENVKLPLDTPTPDSQQDRLPRSSDQNPPVDVGANAEAESQRRRALGLLGEPPRQ